jgi:hypothetical protein
LNLRRLLGRDQVVAELKRRRDAAGRAAGRRIDRKPHQVGARPVDQESVLIELKIAAPGVQVHAAENRLVAGEGARLLDDEIAVPVDRHERARLGILDVALHVVSRDRARQHAAGKLLAGQVVAHQIVELGVDALEPGRLRVRDVAGDVLQRVGLRAQPGDGGRKSVEDTHENSPLGSERPVGTVFDPEGRNIPIVIASSVPEIKSLFINVLWKRLAGPGGSGSARFSPPSAENAGNPDPQAGPPASGVNFKATPFMQ